MMQHKGYTGVIEVDVEGGTLRGRVLGLRDVITFQGKTVQEARSAFETSVEDYLQFCAQRKETPEKPYSGKFLVRIKPETHRKLAAIAELQKISLNALVDGILGQASEGGMAATEKLIAIAEYYEQARFNYQQAMFYGFRPREHDFHRSSGDLNASTGVGHSEGPPSGAVYGRAAEDVALRSKEEARKNPSRIRKALKDTKKPSR